MVDAALQLGRSWGAPALHRTWLANRWFFLIVAVYMVTGILVAEATGNRDLFTFNLYSWQLGLVYAACAALIVFGYVIYVMVAIRPRALVAHLGGGFARMFAPERMVIGIPVLLALPVFVSTFSSLKMMIPRLQPFAWDEAFMEADLLLHGGAHPWALLQPLLGDPAITQGINAVYHLWFFVLYATIFVVAFWTGDLRARARVLTAMTLSWALVGSLAATLLSSAGPCFYGMVVSAAENPYQPLMAYLEEANSERTIWSLDIQRRLWLSHVTGIREVGGGISAMPSIHVATAVLFVLIWRALSRAMGWLMWGFLAMTLIGSVHLGYHYAVDGYLAIALVLPVWWLSGRLMARDRGFDALRADRT